nr:MAG TPA: hypothetical protein [Bacteriophage sp.]DAO81917.1 MAG TPA: hypothetical protein [Caudoviricetes sp.]DAY14336.1 MAG TPA: hypothetical protein [Caudoviricetes sp.]DAY24791.1 MAG TPA: hypothetical protein [Caudoviricetes sp.]
MLTSISFPFIFDIFFSEFIPLGFRSFPFD